MRLPRYVESWPYPYDEQYAERLAIMEAEGVRDAAMKAEADVRARFEREKTA